MHPICLNYYTTLSQSELLGSQREELMELLVPVAANTDGADITEVSLAALSLGMVFVGTCNDEVSFDRILSNIGYIRRNED